MGIEEVFKQGPGGEGNPGGPVLEAQVDVFSLSVLIGEKRTGPQPTSLCGVWASEGPGTRCRSPAQGHSPSSLPAPAASALLSAESLLSPQKQAVISTTLPNKTNLSTHFPFQILPRSFISFRAKPLERVTVLCVLFFFCSLLSPREASCPPLL